MKKGAMRRFVSLAGVVTVATVLAGGCTSNVSLPDIVKVENVEGSSNVILVAGRETVKVVPDMVRIEYAIYTQADTAAQCQTDNAGDLDKAIETLESLGVAKTSIQTSAYGMNPIYNWDSGKQEITGYEMTTRITVSDVPVEEAGGILSQSVAAGVNRIDSVNYFSSNYDASYDEALKGAIAMAQRKAEAIAQASGKSIVGIVRVEENGYYPEARYSVYNSRSSGAAKEEAAMDMALMPGEVGVEAQVMVEFELE